SGQLYCRITRTFLETNFPSLQPYYIWPIFCYTKDGIRVMNRAIKLWVTSVHEPEVKSQIEFLVIDQCESDYFVPALSQEILELASQHQITLSDHSPTGGTDRVDIMFGQSAINSFILLDEQQIIRPRPGLAFVLTKHGWTVMGTLSESQDLLDLNTSNDAESPESGIVPEISVAMPDPHE